MIKCITVKELYKRILLQNVSGFNIITVKSINSPTHVDYTLLLLQISGKKNPLKWIHKPSSDVTRTLELTCSCNELKM